MSGWNENRLSNASIVNAEYGDTVAGINGRGLADIRDAIKALVATAQQAPQPQSSVEISRNAKGEVQFSVKVYAADVDEAMRLAMLRFDELTATYRREPQP